jgi:hypothetical protein
MGDGTARRTLRTVTLLLLLASGCAREPVRCALCRMIVPAETHTVARVDGRPQTICDPRCALTHQAQTGRPVRLVLVTDFESRRALSPAEAHYVTGSDTAPDAQHDDRSHMRTWPAGQASLAWHRCLPSVLAFASRDAAVRYATAHGGRVMLLDALQVPGQVRGAR